MAFEKGVLAFVKGVLAFAGREIIGSLSLRVIFSFIWHRNS
jgi:hypothetical protein